MSNAMKFRKLPVEIEAMQFDGLNTDKLLDWIEPHFADSNAEDVWGTVIDPNVSALSYFTIETLEGTMRAEPGDWIVRGVMGEFYPVKPAIFEQTYEAVTEGAAE